MGSVIYITGAPATGKTTLCAYLARRIPDFQHIAYRELLMAHVADRCPGLSVQALREAPSQRITCDDVDATDNKLIEVVTKLRKDKHVLVDSHPMSKELYGFRIAPFTPDQIAALKPDVIACLYVEPREIARRIEADAQGRPLPSEFELSVHITLQATIAAEYAYALGKTCYLLNGTMPVEELSDAICRAAKIAL